MAVAEYISKQEARAVRRHKAVIIEQSCAEIIEKNGHLTADLLLESARQAQHPLHDYFEWDDSLAAEKWRKAQAVSMIIGTRYLCYLKETKRSRKVKNALKDHAPTIAVRRYLPRNDGGFQDRPSVLKDTENRQSIINKKLSVLRSWCLSVCDIEELQPIREAIQQLLA